ncbi:MAG: NAD(P)/FAD-dependent oxidoreductase [Actinomycetota bacterium]
MGESFEYDAVVVGGGPAGLAAARWLARIRKRTLVIDSCEYRNRWVDKAHGYLGHDPVDPGALREAAHGQLSAYPNLAIVCTTVESISVSPAGFRIVARGDFYVARRVVLATGTSDVFPDIPGFFEHYGSEVFHCPVCDGYEARERKVAVLGWNEKVTGFAVELTNWAKTVTVIAQGTRIDKDDRVRARLANHGVALCEEDAVELLGNRGSLRGIRLQTGEVLDCDYLFFSLPENPVSGLAHGLGCELDEDGHVVVDRQGRTSVEGVYAAGDLTPGEQLIQVAAGERTLAGVACAESLLELAD